MKKSSGSSHVIGVPVTSKAYAIEETTTRDRPAAKTDSDRLAVSLTHPSPYASFGYSQGSKGQVIHWVNKLGRRAQSFRDHGECSTTYIYNLTSANQWHRVVASNRTCS